MSEELRSASDSERPILSDSERAQLVHSVRRCARQKGLSPAVAERYQAWILAFLSWCRDHPPHRVDRGRIGAFQEALQQSADAGEKEVYQAMDALAFLFGAADEVVPLLAAHDASPEDGTASASPAESGGALGDEDRPQTLQVGWQSGAEASDETIRAPQIPPARAPDPPLDPPADAEGEDEPGEDEPEEEASSTAELCIERFQMQVESLHAPDADASEPPGREADPGMDSHPESNAPSS
jgi:hypothetical protein